MKAISMSHKTLRALTSAFVVAALGVSCTSQPKTGAGAGVSSGVSAISFSKSGSQLRPYEEKTLENGLRVLFVPDDSLPYVSYSLLVRAGAAQDSQGESGIAHMTAELLDKGTVKRSATKIAEELDQIGADFDANASFDYTTVSASALSTQADALLANFAEIVMHPAFSQSEISRTRQQILAQVQRRADNPDAFIDMAFSRFLFGERHPYAQPVSGTKATIKAIKKKNLIQHYLRHFRPNNAILAVVGKYTPELAAKVESSFGAWKRRDVSEPVVDQFPLIEGRHILVVDKPGLVQSQIRFGHAGIKRKNEDFLPLRVANTILGGAFTSRLSNRIRKELGLTYSISSYFDARWDVGPFEISTFTKNESAGKTIEETLKTLEKYKKDGVTSAEVERAKGYLKGVFPASIETAEKLAFNLMLLRFYGIPDSYLTQYLSNIDKLSVGDINKVIRQYIDPANIKIGLYTSADAVKGQLEPIGKVETQQFTEFQ